MKWLLLKLLTSTFKERQENDEEYGKLRIVYAYIDVTHWKTKSCNTTAYINGMTAVK